MFRVKGFWVFWGLVGSLCGITVGEYVGEYRIPGSWVKIAVGSYHSAFRAQGV